MTEKLMSIVILNWNRLIYTKQTVECILKKTTMPHEIVFVDNNSMEESGVRQYLDSVTGNKYTQQIIKQYNNKNLGVAGGRNSGLVRASGEYLTTIDDDILVPDGWDTKMAEACDRIPKLGITGVNVEPVKYPVQVINGVKVRPKNGNLGGACLCIPRRIFNRVGYYNYFTTYSHEDAAYFFRLKHIGLLSAYIEPKGVHLDKDNDKAYRKAKNDAHKKGSIQLQALSKYLATMRKTGDVYVPFDPNFDPCDSNIFTNDLIKKG